MEQSGFSVEIVGRSIPYSESFEKGEILLGIFLEEDPSLEKGAEHKYKLRVNNKNPPPKYKYYYNVPSKGIVKDEHLHVGASFKAKDPISGEMGHFHIKEVLSSGLIKVFHDESKKTTVYGPDSFYDMLRQSPYQPIGHAIKEKGDKLLENYKSALKHGKDYHKDARREDLVEHAKAYGEKWLLDALEKIDHKKPKGPHDIEFFPNVVPKFGEGKLQGLYYTTDLYKLPFKVSSFLAGTKTPSLVSGSKAFLKALSGAPNVVVLPGEISVFETTRTKDSLEAANPYGEILFIKLGDEIIIHDGHSNAAVAFAKGLPLSGKMLDLNKPENQKYVLAGAKKHIKGFATVTPSKTPQPTVAAKPSTPSPVPAKSSSISSIPSPADDPIAAKMTPKELWKKVEEDGEAIPGVPGMQRKQWKISDQTKKKFLQIFPLHPGDNISFYHRKGAHTESHSALDHHTHEGIPVEELKDALSFLVTELRDRKNRLDFGFPYIPNEMRTRAEVAVLKATTLFTAASVKTVRDPSQYSATKSSSEVRGAGKWVIKRPSHTDYMVAHDVMKKLAEVPLEKPVAVSRGIELKNDATEAIMDLVNLGKPAIMDLRTISSWTTEERVAKDFGSEGSDHYKIILKMDTKYGSLLHDVSGYESEKEFIIGGKIKINRVEKREFYNKTFIFHCENVEMEKGRGVAVFDWIQDALDKQFDLSAYHYERKKEDAKKGFAVEFM